MVFLQNFSQRKDIEDHEFFAEKKERKKRGKN